MLNKLTKALELDRVIICALFAVALVTWLRIQTEAIFTDFLSKELAFIGIWRENVKGCVTIIITRGVRRNKAFTLPFQASFALNRGPCQHRYPQEKKLVWKRLWCARSQNRKGKTSGLCFPFPLRVSPMAHWRLESSAATLYFLWYNTALSSRQNR